MFTTDSEIAESARSKMEKRAEARRGGRSCLRPEQVIKLVRKRVGYGRAKVEDIEFVGKTRRKIWLREVGGEDLIEVAVYYVRFNRDVSKTAERYLELRSLDY